jgi:uncharacterized protein DUF6789
MVPANPVSQRSHILLAGIEAGVVGGLLMMAWLGLVSLLYGRTVWHPANLIATTFYGEEALRRGFRWATLSGFSLHLVVCVTIAIAFGLLVNRIPGRRRVLLLGLAAGLAWYLIGFTFFWRLVNPVVLEYRPSQAMLVAHLLFGVCLGTLPGYREALRRAGFGPPIDAPAPVVAPAVEPPPLPAEMEAPPVEPAASNHPAVE